MLMLLRSWIERMAWANSGATVTVSMFGGSLQMYLGQPDTTPRLDNIHRFMGGVYLATGIIRAAPRSLACSTCSQSMPTMNRSFNAPVVLKNKSSAVVSAKNARRAAGGQAFQVIGKPSILAGN